MLDNITRRIETGNRRDLLLQTLTQGTRASLASMRAAIETIASFPDMDKAARDRFVGIIGEEAQRLSGRLDETVGEFADSLRTEWPLEDMRGADLIAAARRRIESKLALPTKLETVDESIWLNVDSYSLMQAISYLVTRLREEFGIREVRFGLEAAGPLAHLDVIWTGAPLGTETTMAWPTDSMELGGEPCPLTLKQIVERHNGEIWYQIHKPSHREFFRIAIPVDQARGVAVECAAVRREPARILRFRSLPSARPVAGTGQPAARRVELHGVRHRDHGAAAVPGRRDRVHRRRPHRQRPPARAGGVRAARRSAARHVARGEQDHRHRVVDAREPADDRPGPARVRGVLRGHGAGRAQRRLRSALPAPRRRKRRASGSRSRSSIRCCCRP